MSKQTILSNCEPAKHYIGGNLLIDLRRTKGHIWGFNSVELERGGLESDSDIDEILYHGFRRDGVRFLSAVCGRFGAAYHDRSSGLLFLCRDWIGELPLHYYLTDDVVVIANRISDIKTFLGPDRFRYEFVRAVPHSQAILIDTSEEYRFGHQLRKGWTVRSRVLYYDFIADCAGQWIDVPELTLARAAKAIRQALESSVRRRIAYCPPNHPPAILLSGGLDSLTVAYMLSRLRRDSIAYTISIDQNSSDVRRAREIAKEFGLRHRVVDVTSSDLVGEYRQAVRACELYHLPNVYCASGILALGHALASDGIISAFCGEGVNEALGDYHDWIITDPETGKDRLLQAVDDQRLAESLGRIRYVWGQPQMEGRYNLQLGSGLAKHGVGRMVKPLLDKGVELECPYMDLEVMRRLVTIPKGSLSAVGGKPGLMAKVFQEEIQRTHPGAFHQGKSKDPPPRRK